MIPTVLLRRRSESKHTELVRRGATGPTLLARQPVSVNEESAPRPGYECVCVCNTSAGSRGQDRAGKFLEWRGSQGQGNTVFKGEGEEVGLECRHSQIQLGLAGCGENALMGSGGGAAGQMRSHPRELSLCHVGSSLQGTRHSCCPISLHGATRQT